MKAISARTGAVASRAALLVAGFALFVGPGAVGSRAAESAIGQGLENLGKGLERAADSLNDSVQDARRDAQRDAVGKGIGTLLLLGALRNYEKLETFEFDVDTEPELTRALTEALKEADDADPERKALVENEVYFVQHAKHKLECRAGACTLSVRDNPSNLGRFHPSQKLARDLHEGMLFLEALDSPLVRRVTFDPTDGPQRYGLNAFTARKYEADHYLAIGSPEGRQILCGRLSRYERSDRRACFFFLDR